MDDETLTVDGNPPTVAEAMERLAGRRATAIEMAARVRVVTPTHGQCRKTRRNNLRVARIEARQRAKAANVVRITDSHDAVTFVPATDEQMAALVAGDTSGLFADAVERPRLADQKPGVVTVAKVG